MTPGVISASEDQRRFSGDVLDFLVVEMAAEFGGVKAQDRLVGGDFNDGGLGARAEVRLHLRHFVDLHDDAASLHFAEVRGAGGHGVGAGCELGGTVFAGSASGDGEVGTGAFVVMTTLAPGMAASVASKMEPAMAPCVVD